MSAKPLKDENKLPIRIIKRNEPPLMARMAKVAQKIKPAKGVLKNAVLSFDTLTRMLN